MFSHPCIKCGTVYEDSDPEAYYCESCALAKKKIAEDIDKKRASIQSDSKRIRTSRFSEKDFQGKNGRIFFNAKDLML